MIKLKDIIEALGSSHANRTDFIGLKKNSVVELHDGTVAKIFNDSVDIDLPIFLNNLVN